ncbi:MAG: pitrilysin family protein, partial [Pseudomonadota bacterium]
MFVNQTNIDQPLLLTKNVNDKADQETCSCSVIFDRLETSHSLSVQFFIKAGAKHETLEHTGIAHFLEHMAFKGSQNYNARQQVEMVENVGGSLNAWTSSELTCYHARLLNSDSMIAFDLLADLVAAPLLLNDDIDQERKIIHQEINDAKDQPDDLLYQLYLKAAFGDQILSQPSLGTVESLDRI